MRVFRTQGSDPEEFDAASRESAIACPSSEDQIDQVAALEHDMKRIVDRYRRSGVFPPAISEPQYGEQDMDFRFSDAHVAVLDAFFELPESVRERYGSFRQVQLAIASGELVVDVQVDRSTGEEKTVVKAVDKPAAAAAGGSAAAGGGSPSDSAAGGSPK